MSFKIKEGFELLDSNNSMESLLDYHKKGALRGEYLGFPIFNEKYTMSLPGATDWTGIPSSGKTAQEVIKMALTEALEPTVNLSSSGNDVVFGKSQKIVNLSF